MPKYLVETISVFRLRYVIDADNAECARDEVTMNDASGHLDELSQLHLTETITSAREIDDSEYIRIFDEDNDYLRDWTLEQKFDRVNRITDDQ